MWHFTAFHSKLPRFLGVQNHIFTFFKILNKKNVALCMKTCKYATFLKFTYVFVIGKGAISLIFPYMPQNMISKPHTET